MTDHEQFQIIGQVVKTHEDAKKKLALLTAKGKALSDFVHAVGSALADEASVSVREEGTWAVRRRVNYVGDIVGAWPAAEEVLALLAELQNTKKEIVDLGKRRAELGV